MRLRKGAVFLAIAGILAVLLAGLAYNPVRTLASLKKVDGYPLYVATVHGDYGFDEYLKTGRMGTWWTRLAGRRGGCSTFAALGPGGEPLLGRNYDWFKQTVPNRPSLLLFTDPPHGYASMSMVDVTYLGFRPGETTLADRFSLLIAPHLPFDGMNEAGLAIGMMAVDRSASAFDPGKRTINGLEVIRNVLDHAGDVDEAIELMDDHNINFTIGPPIHYLLADQGGKSAVVEFIDGEMRVLRPKAPWQVSTNFIISEEKPAGADSGCERYNLIYRALEKARGALSAVEAMGLLKAASLEDGFHTIWSIVYDLRQREARVAMGRDYGRVHAFWLEKKACVK